MKNDTLPETPAAQCLKAILDNNLVALQTHVTNHGTEVRLSHSYQTTDEDANVTTREVHGTPLALAGHLRNETLAVYLVHAGAAHSPFGYSCEGWFGWSEQSVFPIESATSFRMGNLALALMRAKHPPNWMLNTAYDDDSMGARLGCPCLFDGLQTRPHIVTFLEELGLFRGIVQSKLVKVERSASGFGVFVGVTCIETVPTMHEGLAALRQHLGVGAPVTRDPKDGPACAVENPLDADIVFG